MLTMAAFKAFEHSQLPMPALSYDMIDFFISFKCQQRFFQDTSFSFDYLRFKSRQHHRH